MIKIKVVITGSFDFEVPFEPSVLDLPNPCLEPCHTACLLAPTPPRAHGSQQPVPEATGLCDPIGQYLKLQLEILKKEQEEKPKTGWHRQAYGCFLSGSGRSLQIRVSTYWESLWYQRFTVCFISEEKASVIRTVREELPSQALTSLYVWSLVSFSSWWSSSVWNSIWDTWKNTALRCKESLELKKKKVICRTVTFSIPTCFFSIIWQKCIKRKQDLKSLGSKCFRNIM